MGKNVATILGYKKPRNAIAKHVDEDDALKWGVTDSLGRIQETTMINESGLYSLILSSKLPKAKEFKRWVTSEVLPAIKRQGVYAKEELSLQLQVLINLELNQQRLEKEVQETKKQVESIREIVGLDIHFWRPDTCKLIHKIATELGGIKYLSGVEAEIFSQVEKRGNVKLNIRLRNKRKKLAEGGMSKTKVKELSLIDVIADHRSLIETYVAVVKEMAVAKGISLSEDEPSALPEVIDWKERGWCRDIPSHREPTPNG